MISFRKSHALCMIVRALLSCLGMAASGIDYITGGNSGIEIALLCSLCFCDIYDGSVLFPAENCCVLNSRARTPLMLGSGSISWKTTDQQNMSRLGVCHGRKDVARTVMVVRPKAQLVAVYFLICALPVSLPPLVGARHC